MLIARITQLAKYPRVLYVKPSNKVYLMSIVNSIPNEWRLVIKQREQHIHPPLNDLIQIKIDGTDTPILKITSKSIYNEFKRKKKQTVPSAQRKIILKYPGLSV